MLLSPPLSGNMDGRKKGSIRAILGFSVRLKRVLAVGCPRRVSGDKTT
jgi:hypothetical protein